MKVSAILSVLGMAVVVVGVFALIAAWAVSVTAITDITIWYLPSGVLVAGVILFVISRVLKR